MEIILYSFRWWLVFFIIGAFFLPLTFTIFKIFFDKGYIFSKIIGLITISYLVFILGLTKLAPFNFVTISIVLLLMLGLNIFLFRKSANGILRRYWKIFIFEEVLFFLGIVFWSYVRAHNPDIHGLEKFMDFGFLNSILRAEYFPPRDMWFTPLPINYYYFGHLFTAVLTKLSFIPANITYNLMLSSLFSFTFVCSFSIGANLIYLNITNLVVKKLSNFKQNVIISFSGLLTAFLVSLSGNLQTIYAFFQNFSSENPQPFWKLIFSLSTFPNSYWYPNATRFIHNTIHEFPSYSFVVSDLHGHVLDIPIVLLAIAVFITLMSQIKNIKIEKIIFVAFLLSVMYMTNAWDGIIYFLFAILIFFSFFIYYQFFASEKNLSIYKILKIFLILGIGFLVFSLPFSLNFKPFASGIGVICAPEFLTDVSKLGPFLFEQDHCARSPWWQLMVLHGFFYFWVVAFTVMLRKNIKFVKSYVRVVNLSLSDAFALILIILSTILVLIPEFIYLKDIYPAHYRANTMFKLTYQEFMMLSIVSSYVFIKLTLSFKENFKSNKFFIFYYFAGVVLISLVLIFPFFSIDSYYGGLKNYRGLDGTKYLNTMHGGDYQAILWINKNIKGQPVILEAQGDSYTDYARVSANTGLPTVLGWTVHEWLWRGSYDIPSPRIGEVETLYTTGDSSLTKKLIDKYGISYIYIGELEKEKYSNLSEEKFGILGKVVYQSSRSKIYQINK